MVAEAITSPHFYLTHIPPSSLSLYHSRPSMVKSDDVLNDYNIIQLGIKAEAQRRENMRQLAVVEHALAEHARVASYNDTIRVSTYEQIKGVEALVGCRPHWTDTVTVRCDAKQDERGHVLALATTLTTNNPNITLIIE